MAEMRECKESPKTQGVDEQITYTVTTTNWGSSPSGVSVAVFNIDNGAHTDVTTTVMPTNSPSVASDKITLSPLKSLTAGSVYRVEVEFTSGGNNYECYFDVGAKT